LNDALNGKYKIGQIQLVEKESTFYLHVPIEKKKEIKRTKNYLGVDLGYRKQAVISVINENGEVLETKVVSYQRHIEKLNYYLSRLSFYQSEAMKKYEKIKPTRLKMQPIKRRLPIKAKRTFCQRCKKRVLL
jgi:transposase